MTYTYFVDAATRVEVRDNKLGLIGEYAGEPLTATTQIFTTTTNTAWLVGLDDCYCLFGHPVDSVEVVVPTPTPTAPPGPPTCSDIWPASRITTLAKGQSPTNNAKLVHAITGHIVDPGSLGDTAHRIPVCSGTEVTAVVTDATGTATNTAAGALTCSSAGCSGLVNATQKYQSISQDGQDKDAITFIPN